MTPRRPNNPAAWPRWATAFSEALRRRPTGVPREDYEELRSAWRALRTDGVRLPSLRQIGEHTGRRDHTTWARRIRRWDLPRPPIGRGPRPRRHGGRP